MITFFFVFKRIQLPLLMGYHRPASQNSWRADDGPTLNAGLVALRFSGVPDQYC